MKAFAFTAVLLVVLAACSDGNISTPNGSDNVGGTSGGDNGNSSGIGVSGLTVRHRNGQTFLVWNESGSAQYHVYRHNSQITNNNLGSATRLTERWGPLDQNTSVNRYGSSVAPTHFVINDLSTPLGDDKGLFVHTTQNGQQGGAYYAVTTVSGGVENRNIVNGANASSQSVNESVSTPRPVLTLSKNGGKGRVYTQYMDYANWNPTLKGYAFNFAVALPANYNSSRAYPLMLEMHAYGGDHKYVDQAQFDWPVIQLFPSDPGESVNTFHTWWYGFAADHNYRTQGLTPRSGNVENFTEQRVIAAVNFIINDGQFNVDRNLVHAYGHSMGASGAVALGMRYPSVFSGIYASEAMTNYGTSPTFQRNFVSLWGERSANLPIVNNGQNNADIRNYGAGGSQATGVWSWMNHQEQLRRRRADRFAYLMVDHGKTDEVIHWPTQGQPMVKALTDARAGFSAAAVGGVGHNWLGFESVVTSVFGLGYGDEAAWRYPRTLSFPGIHFATGSGAVQPGSSGTDRYNTNIEWATPKNNFAQGIVDTSTRYEISIRSTSNNQTADITPRNTNSFKPASGKRCNWAATSISGNQTVGSGNATVDGSRLLTVTGVPIVSGSGTRLVVNCP